MSADLHDLMLDASLVEEAHQFRQDIGEAIAETFGRDADRPVDFSGDGYDYEAA